MEETYIKYRGAAVSDRGILDGLTDDYRRLLERINGFVLFDGGLHVRGAVREPEWHSLRKVWVGDSALHKLYPVLGETDIPFAQDCLGDQFVLRDEVVYRLSADTGELECFEMGLDAFLDEAQRDPVEFLSLQPLLQFMAEGGKLELGQLLNAYPPFCTKQSEQGVSLRAVPMFEQISFAADFAKQLAGLPEGAEVTIKVTNLPDDEN